LFPLFALALDIDEHFFDNKVRLDRRSPVRVDLLNDVTQTTKPGAIMRLLHYPPQTGPIDDRIEGIGAHTEWDRLVNPNIVHR